MKVPSNKLHTSWSDHTIFSSCRLVTWGLACFAIIVLDYQAEHILRDVSLLVVAGLLSVATIMSRSYVHLAQRSAALLGLDIVACCAILWLSGSGVMPFLPFALSSLVLPSLLYGWRGVAVGSATFVLFDRLGMASGYAVTPAETPLAMLIRSSVPLATSLFFAGIAPFVHHSHSDAATQFQPEVVPFADKNERRFDHNSGARSFDAPTAEPVPARRRPPSGDTPSTATQLATVHSHTRPEIDAPRRAIRALTPILNTDLPTTLAQLAHRFGQQHAVGVQCTVIGAAYTLDPPQHNLLLRLAQEALLNIQQHAHAQTAQIALQYERRGVTLVIQDDGVGFMDGTYKRHGMHALRALHHRVAELDGHLAVTEGIESGVIIRATLPRDPNL